MARNRWEKYRMGELYSGFWDGPHATPKESESGPVFLGIKNITEDGQLDLSDIRHISEEDYPVWTKRVVPRSGDIVFSYEATLHRYAIIPTNFVGCLGRRLALIRPNSNVVNGRFLYYYFFGDQWRRTVSKHIIFGSTVDRIPLIHFPNFEVNLPPLCIQNKIASILSAYDDLIENNTHRIRILEEMAQAIYREWFVNFRFPGHEGVRMVESPLGPIPEGWEVCSLSDIAKINPDQIKRTNEPESIYYIDIASVDKGKINNIEPMNFESAPSRARRLVKHGDVIWSTVRPNRQSFALIQNPFPDTIVSTGFAVIRPTKIPYSYIYFAVTTDDFTEYLTNHASGAAYPAVNQSDFENALILYPKQEVSSFFHQQIEPKLSLIDNLRVKNINLRQQRDLLLPRLVSGELDVSYINSNGDG